MSSRLGAFLTIIGLVGISNARTIPQPKITSVQVGTQGPGNRSVTVSFSQTTPDDIEIWYELQRLGNDGKWFNLGSVFPSPPVTAYSLTDNSPPESTIASYRVANIRPNGLAINTSAAAAVHLPPNTTGIPAAPSQLIIIPSKKLMNVSWENNSLTEKGFYIYRCGPTFDETADQRDTASNCYSPAAIQANSVGIADIPTHGAGTLSVHKYVDTNPNLIPNVQYVYSVAAYSAGNASVLLSGAATTSPPTGAINQAPQLTGFTVDRSGRVGPTLNWTDGAHNVSEYTFYRSTTIDGTYAPAGFPVDFDPLQGGIIAELDPSLVLDADFFGKQYFYRVQSSNASFHSPLSNVLAVTINVDPGIAPPPKPTNVTAHYNLVNWQSTPQPNFVLQYAKTSTSGPFQNYFFRVVESEGSSGGLRKFMGILPQINGEQLDCVQFGPPYLRVLAINWGGYSPPSDPVGCAF